MTTEIEEPLVEQTEQHESAEEQQKQTRKKQFSTYNFLLDNILFLLMLFAIALLYIRNAHYSEGLVREIDSTKHEVKEIRWEYMTTKAELMYASKQTEVAKAVKSMGLKELSAPPKKIKVKPE
jgi:fucose permease